MIMMTGEQPGVRALFLVRIAWTKPSLSRQSLSYDHEASDIPIVIDRNDL